MCTQVLEVLDRVEITNVSVSAGHPSSSSIYPACFAPYVITTACSDGTVRFWKCQTADSSGVSENQAVKYEWHEWEMMIRTEDTSSIKVPGLYLCKLYIILIVIIKFVWSVCTHRRWGHKNLPGAYSELACAPQRATWWNFHNVIFICSSYFSGNKLLTRKQWMKQLT